MKKKIIIVIASVFLFFGIIASAAFIFQRIVEGNANTGNINITSKYFVYDVEDENGNVTTQKDDASGTFINCYATQKGGYSDETDDIYLNQLGFEFSFQTDIAVYVRVHFEDAWISKKTYTNGTTNTTYIEKDEIDGKSPFYVNDTNWIYDEETNCAYLKVMVDPNDDVEDNTSYSFSLDEDYFYNLDKSSSYRESIIVQVSYYVDIVQANRAQQKWGVNLTEILGE